MALGLPFPVAEPSLLIVSALRVPAVGVPVLEIVKVGIPLETELKLKVLVALTKAKPFAAGWLAVTVQDPLVRGVKVMVFKTGDCEDPQAGPETFHVTVESESLPPLAVTVNKVPAFPELLPFEPVKVIAGAGLGVNTIFRAAD